jgi:hypothetical protein
MMHWNDARWSQLRGGWGLLRGGLWLLLLIVGIGAVAWLLLRAASRRTIDPPPPGSVRLIPLEVLDERLARGVIDISMDRATREELNRARLAPPNGSTRAGTWPRCPHGASPRLDGGP